MSGRVALVFGFGPFRDVTTNPSELVARRLDRRRVAGVLVHARVLPVSYREAPAALDTAIAAARPACVGALGAGRGDAIALEAQAMNHASTSQPDAADEVLSEYTLDMDGPDRRESALPLEDWARTLTTSGFRVIASRDAGGYVCNAPYLALLRHEELRRRAVFVHPPRQADDDALAVAERVVIAPLTRLLAATSVQ